MPHLDFYWPCLLLCVKTGQIEQNLYGQVCFDGESSLNSSFQTEVQILFSTSFFHTDQENPREYLITTCNTINCEYFVSKIFRVIKFHVK